MRDVVLWNLLDRNEPAATPADADELRALLDDLAATPLSERWPFFGRIDRALAHPLPAVRAAATKALAGAGGFNGFRQIVRMLNDDDPSVRQAAVVSLAVSAGSD